jgi:hypothetical protein
LELEVSRRVKILPKARHWKKEKEKEKEKEKKAELCLTSKDLGAPSNI